MIRKLFRSGVTASLLLVSSLSVGAATASDRFGGAIEGARLLGTLPLDGELFHVQGVELGRRRIWVTSVDRANHKGYLHEFDRATGAFLRRIEVTDGIRYHPGGLSIHGGSIWVPVAEMRPDSTAALVEIDARTLRIRRRIRVADHVGCIAAAGRMLVAGNWNSRRLYVIDLDDPARVRVMPNPTGTQYQDMKFVGDQLVAGGVTGWWSGSVDWIDWPSLTVRRTRRTGTVGAVRPFGRGGAYSGEGMAIEGRDLYVLPEDGPSRLFHFRLEA